MPVTCSVSVRFERCGPCPDVRRAEAGVPGVLPNVFGADNAHIPCVLPNVFGIDPQTVPMGDDDFEAYGIDTARPRCPREGENP